MVNLGIGKVRSVGRGVSLSEQRFNKETVRLEEGRGKCSLLDPRCNKRNGGGGNGFASAARIEETQSSTGVQQLGLQSSV